MPLSFCVIAPAGRLLLRRFAKPGQFAAWPTISPPRTGSHSDRDVVVDLGDSGRTPGGVLGFLPLGPGPDTALEDHFAAIGFDSDAVGVNLRAAAKGFLDLALDLRGGNAWLKGDQVDGPLDASDASHCIF